MNRFPKLGRDIVDVTVRDEGTVALVSPLTPAAERWIDDNVAQIGANEVQFWGDALVVEHRYLYELLMGMQEAGLKVRL